MPDSELIKKGDGEFTGISRVDKTGQEKGLYDLVANFYCRSYEFQSILQVF